MAAQAPMHTKSLAMLRMSHVRRELHRAAKEEGARQEREMGGQATTTNGGAASAMILAMTEKSRALGSSAADLLQKEADARHNGGMLRPCLAPQAPCTSAYPP